MKINSSAIFKKLLRPWNVGVFSFTVIGLVLFINSNANQYNSKLCNICHIMKSASRSLACSRHKNVDCAKCHEATSLLSKVQTGFVLISGKHKETRPVANARCNSCHKSTSDLVAHNGIELTHKNHTTNGLRCVNCHKNTAHKQKQVPSRIDEKQCLSCHEKSQILCNECHISQ